jgi:putative ABC transport system ATP-binding protein
MIELDRVSKIYHIGSQDFTALHEISMKIEQGSFMSFRGPSGSGKTTILNLIGGLDRATSGDIIFKNIKLGDMSRDELAKLRREEIGFIFQSYNLLQVYSVYENILFPLLLNKEKESSVRDKVMNMVEQVGLGPEANKKPSELSGGQCQRVAIARALVKEPSLILADEPTANLDADNSYHILELMQKLNEDFNVAFIFSTHDEKVGRFVKREVQLEDGRITLDSIKTPEGRPK